MRKSKIIFFALGFLFVAADAAQARTVCYVTGRWSIRQSDGAVIQADIVKKDESNNNSELIGVARYRNETGTVSGWMHDASVMLMINWGGHTGKYDGEVKTDRRIEGTAFDLNRPGPRVDWLTDESFGCQ